MMARMSATKTGLPLLFLLLVTGGLFAMHTIGHQGMPGMGAVSGTGATRTGYAAALSSGHTDPAAGQTGHALRFWTVRLR